IDLSGIERIDTIGAWLVHRVARESGAEIIGADQGATRLLEQVAEADRPLKIRPDRTPPFLRVLGEMGDATVQAGRTLLGLLGFFGAVMIAALSLIRNPRRFR